VSEWTLEKVEFYGKVLEDGKLIEVIPKEVKDIIFREKLATEQQGDFDYVQ
jgi:hypothetical protein